MYLTPGPRLGTKGNAFKKQRGKKAHINMYRTPRFYAKGNGKTNTNKQKKECKNMYLTPRFCKKGNAFRAESNILSRLCVCVCVCACLSVCIHLHTWKSGESSTPT